jgi:hypothetical protein
VQQAWSRTSSLSPRSTRWWFETTRARPRDRKNQTATLEPSDIRRQHTLSGMARELRPRLGGGDP